MHTFSIKLDACSSPRLRSGILTPFLVLYKLTADSTIQEGLFKVIFQDVDASAQRTLVFLSPGHGGSGGIWSHEGAVHEIRRRISAGVRPKRQWQVTFGVCVGVCAAFHGNFRHASEICLFKHFSLVCLLSNSINAKDAQ